MNGQARRRRATVDEQPKGVYFGYMTKAARQA